MFALEDIADATVSIPAGLPPRGQWFRAHPDCCVRNTKVLYRPGEKAWYLLSKDLDIPCSRADLHLGVNTEGELFILVASSTEVRKAVEQAKTTWMRRSAGGTGQNFDDSPVMSERQPKWPEPLDFEQLLNGAFGRERYIDRADHPGLRPAAESTEEVMTGF